MTNRSRQYSVTLNLNPPKHHALSLAVADGLAQTMAREHAKRMLAARQASQDAADGHNPPSGTAGTGESP
ncbi:MAG: hypothetical protein ABIM73_06520 [Arenimonas sp.]